MVATPDWLATSAETQAGLAAWARERGLRYAESGLLPPVSDHLRAGLGLGWHNAGVQQGRGALIRYTASAWRPERFSESLCAGELPGGLEGTLAHHSFLRRHRARTVRWDSVGDTVVAARVPEGARVTRELVGRPQKRGSGGITVTEPEYGDDKKQPDLTPELGEVQWELDADEDAEVLDAAFGPAVVNALEATPPLTRVCVRDGWLTVELPEFQSDPEILDALCRAASALAAALRAGASMQHEHGPGAGPLPEPPETPYRRWLGEGADRVAWSRPPPDVRTAIEGYLTVSGDGPHPGRRGRRGFAAVFLLIAGLGVVPAVVVFAIAGAVPGLATLAGTLLLAIVLGLLVGRGARRGEVRNRAEAWGREAFAREYARARGLQIEDAEQVRRSIPIPLPGRPERSMYGRLGDGVDGRLVLWRDRTHPESGNRAMNLALVPAPSGNPPATHEPYEVARAGGWLIVAHDLGTGVRTAAALDALSAEADRLGRV